MQFLDLDVQDIGKALAALDGIKDLDEFLLFFDSQTQV